MNPAARAFPLHEEASADVAATASQVFAQLDDHRNLSGHMEASSPMMAGSSMRIETDAQGGRAVGSHIRLAGRVLGMTLSVDEAVTEHDPPRRKAWQTLGEPRLLVIGGYRMGFDVLPLVQGSRVRLWIDYALPQHGVGRWLGRLLGGVYARWCTRQMLRGGLRGLLFVNLRGQADADTADAPISDRTPPSVRPAHSLGDPP